MSEQIISKTLAMLNYAVVVVTINIQRSYFMQQ